MDETSTCLLEKVISGGQTGADQAGLKAAARFGIPTGGWMPHGFKTEDGPNPQLATRFGLREHRGDYKQRTATNVRISDGTIRIAGTFNSLGEKCTLNCLRSERKPFIDVDIHAPIPVADVVAWIHTNQIRVLNVAGNTRPTSPTAKSWGIEEFTVDFPSQVFRNLGHKEVTESPTLEH